jgi:hypothetical protein
VLGRSTYYSVVDRDGTTNSFTTKIQDGGEGVRSIPTYLFVRLSEAHAPNGYTNKKCGCGLENPDI